MQETAEARILLVSSDAEQVRLQVNRLSGVGYVVRACNPDADGSRLFAEFDPLVTIVDLAAGSPEAAEFLERGRRAHPSSCFLALAEPAASAPAAEVPANGGAASGPYGGAD